MSQTLPNIPSAVQSLTALKQMERKGLAMLLDPDKLTLSEVPEIIRVAEEAGITYFFVGGSLLVNSDIYEIIPELKRNSQIPVILFPGSIHQIVPTADAIFFLSLISGRNPDLLIGNHVIAAPILRQTRLEIIPTGYILVESGKMTTVNYISNTLPIPADKPDIAVCTAMAGEMLGLKVLYMDGGSGAAQPISTEMVKAVSKNVSIPLIVGGGIRDAETAEKIWTAGAQVVVVGNALENSGNLDLLYELGKKMRELNRL